MGQVAEHTSGPWKVGRSSSGYAGDTNYVEILRDVTFVEGCEPITYLIGRVTYPTSGPNTVGMDEREANARLIAASPETARELDELRERNHQLIRNWDLALADKQKAEAQRDELLAALQWALPHVLKREGWIKPSSDGDMAGCIPKEIADNMFANYSVFKTGLNAMKAAIANAGGSDAH